jgi:hypothetical protein
MRSGFADRRTLPGVLERMNEALLSSGKDYDSPIFWFTVIPRHLPGPGLRPIPKMNGGGGGGCGGPCGGGGGGVGAAAARDQTSHRLPASSIQGLWKGEVLSISLSVHCNYGLTYVGV